MSANGDNHPVFGHRDWQQIKNALAFYADPQHWGDDDWGVRAVIQPPAYGRPSVKAKRALDAALRLERT